MEQVEKGEETRESWSAAGEEEAGLALNEVVSCHTDHFIER